MQKLQTNDPVMVIAGKHKGKISTITKLDGDKIYVKDVNIMKKGVKGKGFVDVHHAVHRSNVMYYLEKDKKPVRVKVEVAGKKKTRKSVGSNVALPKSA